MNASVHKRLYPYHHTHCSVGRRFCTDVSLRSKYGIRLLAACFLRVVRFLFYGDRYVF